MFDDFDLISVYSRSDAIQDGVLVDLTNYKAERDDTPLLKHAGFIYPVAITSAVYHLLGAPQSSKNSSSYSKRLWNFLMALKIEILKASPTHEMRFSVFIMSNHDVNSKLEEVPLKAIVGPGDNREPVITVMLPHED